MKINLKNAQIIETEVKTIKNKPAKLVIISDGHNWLISSKNIYRAMNNFKSARNKFKHIHYDDDDLLLTKKIASGLYPQLITVFENHDNRLRFIEPEKVIKALKEFPDSNSRAYLNCIKSKRIQKLVAKVKPKPLSEAEQIHKMQAQLDAVNARANQLEIQNEHESNSIDAAREDLKDKEIEYNKRINDLSEENLKLRTYNRKLNDINLNLEFHKNPKKLTRWEHLKAFFNGEVE